MKRILLPTSLLWKETFVDSCANRMVRIPSEGTMASCSCTKVYQVFTSTIQWSACISWDMSNDAWKIVIFNDWQCHFATTSPRILVIISISMILVIKCGVVGIRRGFICYSVVVVMIFLIISWRLGKYFMSCPIQFYLNFQKN